METFKVQITITDNEYESIVSEKVLVNDPGKNDLTEGSGGAIGTVIKHSGLPRQLATLAYAVVAMSEENQFLEEESQFIDAAQKVIDAWESLDKKIAV